MTVDQIASMVMMGCMLAMVIGGVHLAFVLVFLAVVFQTRFVAAKRLLLGDRRLEFRMRVGQRIGNHAVAKLRQISATHGHLHNVGHPSRNRRVTAMGTRFQPADHGQHARPEDRSPFEFGYPGEDRFSVGRQVLAKLMFGDMDRYVEQFDVLNDLKLVGRRKVPSANFRVGHFINERLVNSLGRQRQAERAFSARLATPFPTLASRLPAVTPFRRFDDIARWRLGRV